MDPELWQRIADIAGRALDLAPEVREAFARKECGDDAELLRGVLDMLSDAGEAQGFLDEPSPAFPEDFGRFRAVREIGHGGMSLVYLGERIERDFEQRAAIKVILHKAAGTLQQSEARILAGLEHPNIARFLDAGVTRSGLPYLAMEYIEGQNCGEYAAGLPDEASKLRLFLQVCAGVQFANRSLIVHRDLKPGNILVDKNGVAKILDFGIAKIVSPEPGEITVGTRAYTPDYASPEQILGLPVTTATDVYSLGVLLCEMLAGAKPRSLTELPMPDLVKHAQSEVDSVPLAGDLARIARKALRRDPVERYESAGALARDIERYLEGRPIEARPPSFLYVARKFVGRNRYALGFATLAFAALAGMAGFAFRQARIASERFDQVRSLAGAVMFELHDAVKPLPGSLPARQLIVKKSVAYLDALAANSSAGGPALQMEIAKGYRRLGDIEGTGNKDNLGDSESGLRRLEQALAIMRRVVAADPGVFDARTELFLTLDEAAHAHESRARYPEAVALAEEALRLASESKARFPNELYAKQDFARAHFVQANMYTRSRAHRDAVLPAWDRAVAAWRELSAADPKDREVSGTELARCVHFRTRALLDREDYPAARASGEEALRLHRELAVQDKSRLPMVAMDLGYLGEIALRQGRLDEASSLMEESLAMHRARAQADTGNVNSRQALAISLNRLADLRMAQGSAQAAVRLGEESAALQREVWTKDPGSVLANRELIRILADLAAAHAKVGDSARSSSLLREALPLLDGPASKAADSAAERRRKDFVRQAANR